MAKIWRPRGNGHPNSTPRNLKSEAARSEWQAFLPNQVSSEVFDVPKDEAARKELLAKWHAEKTLIYQDIIASGAIPARAGVKRLAEEALTRDWKLAVASTSAKPSVDAVLHHAVGPGDGAAIRSRAGR